MNQFEMIDKFLSSPLANRYKCVHNQWFVCEDGFWVHDHGSLRIRNVIRTYSDYLGWVQGGNAYMVDRIRRELAVRLQTDRLPIQYQAQN